MRKIATMMVMLTLFAFQLKAEMLLHASFMPLTIQQQTQWRASPEQSHCAQMAGVLQQQGDTSAVDLCMKLCEISCQQLSSIVSLSIPALRFDSPERFIFTPSKPQHIPTTLFRPPLFA